MPKRRLKVQVWIWIFQRKPPKLRVLLLKTRPERGCFWQPVTGSVEPAETIEKAALREAHEETGLPFAGEPEPLGKPFSFRKRGEIFLEYGFFLRVRLPRSSQSPPKVRLDPHEHTDYEWLGAGRARRRLAYASNIKQLELLLTHLRERK